MGFYRKSLQRGLPSVTGRAFVAALAMIALCGSPANAILDEAHSFAMEIADAHVQKGFAVREDYWNGEIKPGEKKIIRHQLFKGNEYWFWIGSSADEARPKIAIYDLDGKLVQVEHLEEMHMAAARVLPPKTGSYLILITVECEGAKTVDWALAYGYR